MRSALFMLFRVLTGRAARQPEEGSPCWARVWDCGSGEWLGNHHVNNSLFASSHWLAILASQFGISRLPDLYSIWGIWLLHIRSQLRITSWTFSEVDHIHKLLLASPHQPHRHKQVAM
jgi:hypothetical protein